MVILGRAGLHKIFEVHDSSIVQMLVDAWLEDGAKRRTQLRTATVHRCRQRKTNRLKEMV
jgi:hypothetical protein